MKKRKRARERIRSARFVVLAMLGLSFLIFLIIGGLASLNEGVSAFVGTIESINPVYYGLALLAVFVSNLVGFPKWAIFIKKLGVKVDGWKNLSIYLSMFSMDITPGRWGRAVVAYTLNQLTGTRFGSTFPAVVADILTDFLGFIIIALVSAFLVKTYAIISIVISILLLIPFFFIYERRPFDYVEKKLWKFKRLRGIFEQAELYFESSKSLNSYAYLYALVFTIPAVAISGVSLYLVILSFGIPLTPSLFPTVLFIYTSSFLIGMVTGIPGALGVTDAALLGYLVAFFPALGVTFGVASAIVIFFRIANLWFMEGISTGFLIYTFRFWKR